VAYNLLDIRVELEKAEAPARQRPLVLMVDDDLADRELYGSVLCYNGFDVLLSRSGSDAVTQARRFVPDCVLLDLGLPGLSGLEVAAELRGTPETRGVPVVVLSGYPRDRMGARAVAAGCLAYIEKPIEPFRVLKAIEAVVGRPPLAGEGELPRILGPLDDRDEDRDSD
jgi:CheY-like chemotaxis protein